MTDDATQPLAAVDALLARGEQQRHTDAARAQAVALGADPDMAAKIAMSTWAEPPARLGGKTPGVFAGHQNPVIRQRVERIRAACEAGRVTPAEGVRVLDAMSVDERAATQALDAMPPGRLPLAARAHIPDPENPLAGVAPSGPLPQGMSLLSASEQAEVAERRR